MKTKNHSTTLTVRSFRLEGERDEQEECLTWIHDQKIQIERSRYGNNRRAIADAIDEVAVKKTAIDEYRATLQKVLKETSSEEKRKQLQDAFDSLWETADKKMACLQTMLEITSLEEHCGNLHRIMDTSAVDLVRPDQRGEGEDMPGENNLGFIAPSSQDCIFAVQDNWQWVVKLVKCIDTHLNNGATYHKFFHEIEESQQWLNEDLKRLHDSFELHPIEGELKDATKLLKELRELAVALKQWEVKVDRFWDTATKVVPVHIRVHGADEPVPARILADYETQEIRLREGEDVLMVENSDPNMWTIRNSRGQDVRVPALIVLIPGPDKAAVDAAVKMKLQLLSAWTNTLKRIGKRLLCFMLMVFKPDYNTDEINLMRSIPPLDKQDLMRILDHIEDSLKVHWSDHEGFLTLQERVLQLRMILEESGDDVMHDKEKYKALVVQITMLEKLMDNYKDLWKDWEKYKVALEASRSPELMLVVDKWEQLQFVTRADFANFDDKESGTKEQTLKRSEAARRFWQSELPFDEMEKKLSGLRELTANLSDIGDGAHLGDESVEETIDFSMATAVGSAAPGEVYNLASLEDTKGLISGAGTVTVTRVGGGGDTRREAMNETRVDTRTVRVVNGAAKPMQERVSIGRPSREASRDSRTVVRTLHEGALPEMENIEFSSGADFKDSREVTQTVRTIHEGAMPEVEDVDWSTEEGFEDSRVVTQTVRTVESVRPRVENSGMVTTTVRTVQEGAMPMAQTIEGTDGISEEGFDESRVVTQTVRTMESVRPRVEHSGMVSTTVRTVQEGAIPMTQTIEGTDGISEEGFDESRVVTHTVRTMESARPRVENSGMATTTVRTVQEGILPMTQTIEGDDGSSGEGFDETRTVTRTIRTVQEQAGVLPAMEGVEGFSEEGFSDTQTVTRTVRMEGELGRARATHGGTHDGGFVQTRLAETRYGAKSARSPLGSTEMETTDDGMFEEGVYEHRQEFEASRARVGSTDGTHFGLATETKTAETEQLNSAEMEERKTFVIRSVINPEDQGEISLQQSIMAGVICPKEGVYFNKASGEKIPIPLAMGGGLIKVEFTTVRRSPEKKSSIGLITVKTIREQARPYIIVGVKDTLTGRFVEQDNASKQGLLDERRGSYFDRASNNRMLLTEAIEKGLMTVEYQGEAPEAEVISQMYAVRAVVDRRLKKVITFHDAVRRGIIDKESGAYKDTLSGEKMYVGDAIMRGFLKARPIDKTKSMDIDPINQMMIDKTEKIHKKIIQPLQVISAFKKAASAAKN